MAKRRYHTHLPRWPSFSWTKEKKDRLPNWFKKEYSNIDGDLPSTAIRSWQDFHAVVNDDRFSGDQFIFRGQRDSSWDLRPSIARSSPGGDYSAKEAREALESFRRSSRGRKAFDPSLEEDLEMWALGQHHGLRTPLLDWTESPFVALFFAFEIEDPKDEEPPTSRCIFAINKTRLEARVRELVDEESYGLDAVIRIFQPGGDSNRRLLSQAGLFLAVPPRETVTSWLLTHFGEDALDMDVFSDIVMKIHVPNDDRIGCLRMLRRMNIHHASLFPDLIGSSNYSNFEMEVYRDKEATEA